MQKPGRTFGIMVAIAASTIWYSIIPLLVVGQIVALQLIIPRYDFGTGESPLFAGIEFRGMNNWAVFARVVFSLAFLLVAIFAWRGKPRFARWLLVGAVIAVTVFNALTALIALATPPSLEQGFDSAQGAFETGYIVNVIGSLLIALYVVWYMNRAPARAFYRGYYLPEPDKQPHPAVD